MTTTATEQNPVGISKEDTPANRAALRVALLTLGHVGCSTGGVQDALTQVEDQRAVAQETGLPYLSVHLALEHRQSDSGLTIADLDQWEAAEQWMRDVTREAVVELKALCAAAKAARS